MIALRRCAAVIRLRSNSSILLRISRVITMPSTELIFTKASRPTLNFAETVFFLLVLFLLAGFDRVGMILILSELCPLGTQFEKHKTSLWRGDRTDHPAGTTVEA